MKIEIIPCLNDNYSYLVLDESTKTISLIDPAEFNTCDKIIQKYKRLDYILNTHHHVDHVDGNLKLKEKYSAKVLGFELDKNRIPGIDILLKEGKLYKIGNLEFEVIFTPGHTAGHIAFYFRKEKIVFTGDTLFSLGCGRIFEGSYKEMFESLNKIKLLPEDTKIYCGHEYTLNNAKFCKKYDSENKDLQKKVEKIEKLIENGIPTIPSTLKEELECNIFLRAKDIKTFSKLRDFKDNF